MKTIGLISRSPAPELHSKLAAIGEVVGARFVAGDHGGAAVDAWLYLDATEESVAQARTLGVPSFLIVSPQHNVPCGASDRCEISRSAPAPFPYAGRSLQSKDAVELAALPSWAQDFQPLGTKGGMPFWSVKSGNGAPEIWICSAPLTPLSEGEALFDHFNADRFIALLPLLSFLRRITAADEWQRPALHACFMFDDPNLHSLRYGYIDFPELAAHARAHRYHVASATIPIDAWFVHAPTSRLFRENADVISLLVHGNDHIHEELGRRATDSEREHTIAQALRRIARLERRSGVRVSRSMAPPHGACSDDMLGTMAKLRFESACISRGSLRHYNRGAPWVPTVGMRPADVIKGLPVLSRFRITRQCHNSILLAAYLGQPIIPVGHHQDVADGLAIFGELADFINQLGNVRWTDLSQMARGIYSQQLQGSTLHVRMDTRHADLTVPAGVDTVRVEKSWLSEPEAVRLTVQSPDQSAASHSLSSPAVLQVSPQQHLSLSIEQSTPIAAAGELGNLTRKNRLALWPMTRRLLTEGRDRLSPAYRKLRSG